MARASPVTYPAVSVVLPVRDGGAYLAPAVESILAQEGVAFELLVVDDGSSDGTAAWLAGVRDPRLRVLRREGGGLVAALNAGIAATGGRYIARMDADDIALPGRLRVQAELLDREAAAAIACSSVHLIDGDGRRTGRIDAEELSPALRLATLLGERRGPPIIHPSVMMRRAAIEAVGGYRDSPVAEDHELWLRLAERHGFRAIAEPLLDYRHHGGGVSRARAVEQAVSNLMNCACHRLRAARGIDLMDQAPAAYAALRAWTVQTMTPRLTHIAEARRLRSELRRGDRLAALRAMARFPLRRAGLLRAAGISRALLDAQQRVLREGVALLDADHG